MMKFDLTASERRILAKNYADQVSMMLLETGDNHEYRSSDILERIERLKEIVATLPPSIPSVELAA